MMKILSFLLPLFLYKKVLKYKEFIDRERKFSDKIPLAKKIWLWKNGFNSRNLRMFGLTPDNISNYLSYRTYENMHPINGPYSNLINCHGLFMGVIDVVVTENSFKILEINSFPGINSMQMVNPPLLEDKRVAKFYKYYSIR